MRCRLPWQMYSCSWLSSVAEGNRSRRTAAAAAGHLGRPPQPRAPAASLHAQHYWHQATGRDGSATGWASAAARCCCRGAAGGRRRGAGRPASGGGRCCHGRAGWPAGHGNGSGLLHARRRAVQGAAFRQVDPRLKKPPGGGLLAMRPQRSCAGGHSPGVRTHAHSYTSCTSYAPSLSQVLQQLDSLTLGDPMSLSFIADRLVVRWQTPVRSWCPGRWALCFKIR